MYVFRNGTVKGGFKYCKKKSKENNWKKKLQVLLVNSLWLFITFLIWFFSCLFWDFVMYFIFFSLYFSCFVLEIIVIL